MWAQVLTGPKDLQYKQVAIPQVKPDEVLVKLETAAICTGSDPDIYDGHGAYMDLMPFVFGHEPFGEIVACGDEVEGFEVGDKVSWWFCFGAFAEYVAVKPGKLNFVKVPKEIPAVDAPMIELMTAAVRAVASADIDSSSRVLIVGLGPGGLVMSQRAKILGAAKVVGWDLYPMRREKGLTLGCDAAYDPRSENIVEQTRKLIGQADVVLDAMGDDILPQEPTLDDAVKVIRPKGKIVSFGHPRRRRRLNTFNFQLKELTMCSPVQDRRKIQELMVESVGHVAAGRLKLGELVSEVIRLEEVGPWLDKIRNNPDKYLKVVVDINKKATGNRHKAREKKE